MLNTGSRRLIISLDDLRMHSRDLCDGILKDPTDHLGAFDKALHDAAIAMHDPVRHAVNEDTVFYTGFKGSFGGIITLSKPLYLIELSLTECRPPCQSAYPQGRTLGQAGVY